MDHGLIGHPESPDRIKAILSSKNLTLDSRGEWQAESSKDTYLPLGIEMVFSTHGREFFEKIKKLDQAGGGSIDADTFVSHGSFDTAMLSITGSFFILDSIMQKSFNQAMILQRPPGHHATASLSMGFCLFNHIALATNYLKKHHQVSKILIVDFDVHHGNGTQDIFYKDDSVFFYSIHRYPFYPGSGSHSETGTGKGLGYTLNHPMDLSTSQNIFVSSFEKGLEVACKKIKPEFILVSAGFDGHKDDPIGGINLDSHSYFLIGQIIRKFAEVYSSGRVFSLLEGGYNTRVLPECIASFKSGIESHE